VKLARYCGEIRLCLRAPAIKRWNDNGVCSLESVPLLFDLHLVWGKRRTGLTSVNHGLTLSAEIDVPCRT